MRLKLLYLLVFLSVMLSRAWELQDFRVDFHQSMNADYANHDENFCRTDAEWLFAEDLYKKYFQHGIEFTNEPRIPYIIHHIWLGSPLPDYAKYFRRTWVNKHPDWIFILWTDYPERAYGDVILNSFNELENYLKMPNHKRFIVMNMRNIRLRNQVAYDTRTINYGEKSDLIRYEVLYKFGGLYVDTDFECLRSFTDFHHCLDFYTGTSYTKEFSLCNGLMGSAPGMSILEEMIRLLETKPREMSPSLNGNDSLKYCGPHFFTECFLRRAADEEKRVVAFPVTYFYPWPAYLRFQDYAKAREYIRKESYGLHYWKVSWLAKRSIDVDEGTENEAQVLDYVENICDKEISECVELFM